MAADDDLYPCLHHLESSASLRVLWALEELNERHGVQYRIKIYNRDTKGNPTKAVHPLGKSPILCIGPRPEQALSETRLILLYLAQTYSQGIWDPPNEEDKARDAYFQEFAGMSLLKKTDLVLMFDLPNIAYPFGLRHLVTLLTYPFKHHMLGDLKAHYQYMEDSLSDEKPWFGGKSRGLADFVMTFGMDMGSQRGYFDGNSFPRLANWLERVHALPAYRRALEKGGKNNLISFN